MQTADTAVNIAQELLPLPAGTGQEPSSWGARHAHDPTVVQDDDGIYYMFSTDAVANSKDIPAGVHIRTSTDLVEWSYRGTALDGVPEAAATWSGAQGLWAPDVVRWPNGEWHMYYSASTFGSNTSAIGLAVAPSPAGPWGDRGLVVATRKGEHSQNAIDAAVTFDADGLPWLTYGSFFSGIYILPLDRNSGLPLVEGDLGSVIARRAKSVEGAVEGAFILHRPEDGRYVLFCSYDSLFNSYNMRVGTAESITGPYRDFRGNQLTDLAAPPASVGTKVLGSYQFDGGTGWLAPGHNSVLTRKAADGSAEYFAVHHVRFAEDPSQHVVQLRRVFFTASGWPVVSPQPFAGAERETLPASLPVAGSWQVLRFAPESADLVPAVAMQLECIEPEQALSNGAPVPVRLRVTPPAADGAVRADGAANPHGAVEPHAAVELDAVVFGSWDWAAKRPALSFSGIDQHGVAWSGTREVLL